MAGEHRWLGAIVELPEAPHGNPGGKKGRLREFRPVELIVGTRMTERPEVDASTFRRFSERIPDDGVRFGEACEHAQRLRALTGEHAGKSSVLGRT
jgi:hypothetical protein